MMFRRVPGWLHAMLITSPERDEAEAEKYWHWRFREHPEELREAPMVAPKTSASPGRSPFLFRFDTCVGVAWAIFAILAATLQWSFQLVVIGIVAAIGFAAQAAQQYYLLQRRRHPAKRG